MSEWQDIESAPRDGTLIDLWARTGRITNMRWVIESRKDVPNQSCIMDGWKQAGDIDPYGCFAESQFTHWMPLPSPPSQTTNNDNGEE